MSFTVTVYFINVDLPYKYLCGFHNIITNFYKNSLFQQTINSLWPRIKAQLFLKNKPCG